MVTAQACLVKIEPRGSEPQNRMGCRARVFGENWTARLWASEPSGYRASVFGENWTARLWASEPHGFRARV